MCHDQKIVQEADLVDKFILMATQRSGSSWVIDMLNSHPSIKTYEELFSASSKKKPTWVGEQDVLMWKAYWQKRQSNLIRFVRPYFCFSYLNKIYTPHREKIRIVGFKLMYDQLKKHPEILAFILMNKVLIIHLIRNNFLDVIVSHEAKKKRGIPHSKGKVNNVKVNLNIFELQKKLDWQNIKVQSAKRILSCLPVPYLEVTYEDLISGTESFDTILKILGVDPGEQELQTSLKKLNKGTHREIIENYEEVSKLLDGTKYARLLH